MLKQAFGNKAMSRTQTHNWYKHSKEGRTSVEDIECSGRPSTSKNEEIIQKVQKVIHSNHCLTVREVAEEAGISKTTCHEILTENLDMHHVAAKFVLHLLSEDQKQNYVDVSR
jgi:response regulator of citrate/malate metabolism